AVTADSIPTCDSNTAATNGVTTATLFLGTVAPTGAFVAVTLNSTATGINANIQDAAGNFAVAPRTNTTTATAADTTKPTLVSASGATGSSTVTLTFSEPVYCSAGFTASSGVITIAAGTAAPVNALMIFCPGTNTPATAGTTVTFTTAPLAASTAYTVTINTVAGATLSDIVGNTLTTPTSAVFTTGAADTAGPLSQDIRMTTNAGLTATLDTGDVFKVSYNEVLGPVAAGATIRLTDADGTIVDVVCGAVTTCALSTSAQTIGGVTYPTGQTLTVTIGATGVTTVAAGTVAGLQIPATVTDSSGITDVAGNPWNIPVSPDKTLN
ncbi:MAG: hypothetical protein M3O91_07450, partial [Chloroflexota bacterium]|nr:hypothetical protein [Chloroflexota bacterium]